MVGRFITIEGPDGAGKSTLAKTLCERLQSKGIGSVLTREPGDGPIGPEIRSALLDSAHLDAWTEAFLFLADRRQHCEHVIRPALDRGEWVICDRFADSTVVYQGYGRGLPVATLKKLNEIACGGLEPDLTFLLDLAPEAGLSRITDKNRLDEEPLAFHERIRHGFLTEAEGSGRWQVLDAALPPEIVAQEAMCRLEHLLQPRF